MPQTIKGQPIDDKTAALHLPLPHLSNWQDDDIPRVRIALDMIDAAMQLLGLDMDTRDEALTLRAQQVEARAALLEYAAARPSAVAYGYDAQGRVATITQTVGGAARTTTLTYDSQSRVASAAYPVAGGATRIDTYNYDASGRVGSVTSVEAKP